MRDMGRWIVLGILLGISWIDIRTHQVPVNVLRAGGVFTLLYHIFFGDVVLWEVLAGAGIGVLFLIISRVTDEKMGYGDSWGIVILGCLVGFRKLLEVLMTAFLLLAVFAIILLSRKSMSGKCTIPFFPFLTCGYIVLLLTEEGII